MEAKIDAVWTNLGLSALALLACLIPLWLISLKIKDASIIDIFWGFGFVVVAITCLAITPKTPYVWLLAALPIIWGMRLTAYLAKRNLGHGEDRRYVAMRTRSGMDEMAWRRRAFFTIYLGQGLLILIVSAPVWIGIAQAFYRPDDIYDVMNLSGSGANPFAAKTGILAIIGTALWLIGFLFEAVGDAQLAAFLKRHKNYDGPMEDKPVLDTGLWKYTRHPNYFGNACMWWGIWLVACAAPWGWVSVFAPIIMTLLLVRVSGKDLLERHMKKRPAYRDYVARTSGFFPWFPRKG